MRVACSMVARPHACRRGAYTSIPARRSYSTPASALHTFGGLGSNSCAARENTCAAASDLHIYSSGAVHDVASRVVPASVIEIPDAGIAPR